MSIESTTQSISDLALKFGEQGKGSMSRPFGVALLVGGVYEVFLLSFSFSSLLFISL